MLLLLLMQGLDDYDVRYWCAKGLGNFRESSAVPRLVQMMLETRTSIRAPG